MTTDLKECKTISNLTPFQIKQKQFILQEYPMLDDFMVDTIVRMKKDKINEIVSEMKSGELKLDEKDNPENYTIKSVEIE